MPTALVLSQRQASLKVYRDLLQSATPHLTLKQTSTLAEVLDNNDPPGLLLIDLDGIPSSHYVEIEKVVSQHPAARIVALSEHDAARRRAIQFGAHAAFDPLLETAQLVAYLQSLP